MGVNNQYRSLHKRVDDTYFYEVDYDAVDDFAQEEFIADVGNKRKRGYGYHSNLKVRVVIGIDTSDTHTSFWRREDGTMSSVTVSYADLIAALNQIGYDVLGGLRGKGVRKLFKYGIENLIDKQTKKYARFNRPIFNAGVRKLARTIRDIGRDYVRGSYIGDIEKPDLAGKTIEIREKKQETNSGLYGGVRGIYEPLYESGMLEGDIKILECEITGEIGKPPERSHHKGARRMPKAISKSRFDSFLDKNKREIDKIVGGEEYQAAQIERARDAMNDRVKQASIFADELVKRVLQVDKFGNYKMKTPSGVKIGEFPIYSDDESKWREASIGAYKQIMGYLFNKSGFHPDPNRRRGWTDESHLRAALSHMEKEYPDMYVAFSVASKIVGAFGLRPVELVSHFTLSKNPPKD